MTNEYDVSEYRNGTRFLISILIVVQELFSNPDEEMRQRLLLSLVPWLKELATYTVNRKYES